MDLLHGSHVAIGASTERIRRPAAPGSNPVNDNHSKNTAGMTHRFDYTLHRRERAPVHSIEGARTLSSAWIQSCPWQAPHSPRKKAPRRPARRPAEGIRGQALPGSMEAKVRGPWRATHELRMLELRVRFWSPRGRRGRGCFVWSGIAKRK
jgi:hypothetical protein